MQVLNTVLPLRTLLVISLCIVPVCALLNLTGEEKRGLREEKLYLYPLNRLQMCNTGSCCQTWPISFCRSKIQIMLEIAPEGHLFDDKTHPALNRDKPFGLQDFSNGCKTAACCSRRSELLHAFDRFNRVQVTLFFQFPWSFSKCLFYLMKLKG